MNIHAVYAPFLRHFRAKRKRVFHEQIRPQPDQQILDVGGYHSFWLNMDCPNPITCLNVHIPALTEALPEQFQYVEGDGRSLPYGDAEIDIVYSNSTIEHLHAYEDQERFAHEVRRVAKSYWVQTPARWFPVEPHLITPLIHYFPKAVQKHLIRWCTVWGWIDRPSKSEVEAFLAEVRLLTEEEMKKLFPDARIMAERFMGLKKSFIAVKTGHEAAKDGNP